MGGLLGIQLELCHCRGPQTRQIPEILNLLLLSIKQEKGLKRSWGVHPAAHQKGIPLQDCLI